MKKLSIVFCLLLFFNSVKSADVDDEFDKFPLKKQAILVSVSTIFFVATLQSLFVDEFLKKTLFDSLPENCQAKLLEHDSVLCYESEASSLPKNITRSQAWQILRNVQNKVEKWDKRVRHMHLHSPNCLALREELVEELNWVEDQINSTIESLQSNNQSGKSCVLISPKITKQEYQMYKECMQAQKRKQEKLSLNRSRLGHHKHNHR